MKKIYRCDKIALSMPITLNGKGKTITFKGGSYGGGMAVNARYVTEDEAEMAAIEETDRFKRGRIIIDGVFGEPSKVFPSPVMAAGGEGAGTESAQESGTPATSIGDTSVEKKDSVEATFEAPTTSDVDTEAVSYPEVTNFQQAKNTLITKHGVVFEGHANKEAVLKAAGELNVTFPNWN